ncbi:MAG: fumarylacetoacetate hydrolase family protein [Pseudomonadota bacterium]
MDQQDIHRIARERFNGWQNREIFSQLTGDDKPDNMADAYEIQSAVYELMRQEDRFTEFGGHKVALTSPAIQEMCGVSEPAYGAVFKEFIYSNNHTVKASDFIRFGVEFEVAFEIGTDFNPGDAPFDQDKVAQHIAAAMPAFELIDDRDADYAHLDAASILTDRCWCNGIVLGDRIEDWRKLEIGNLSGEVVVNGTVNDRGNTGAALGNPLNSVVFVANHLAERGQVLKAGDVIMTGSAMKTQFSNVGDQVTYRIEGLGEVSITLTE